MKSMDTPVQDMPPMLGTDTSRRAQDLLAAHQENIKIDRLATSAGGCVELARLAHRDLRAYP